MIAVILNFVKTEIMNTVQRTTFFTLLLLLMTCIHHVYGAIVYHTHWRLHVVFIAVPVAAAVWLLHYFYAKNNNSRALFISYAMMVLLFPVMLIGIYEGLYNHLVKNIIFPFTGNSAFFKMLFPPPAYETPNNVLFEVTGVLQAFILYPLLQAYRRLLKHDVRH